MKGQAGWLYHSVLKLSVPYDLSHQFFVKLPTSRRIVSSCRLWLSCPHLHQSWLGRSPSPRHTKHLCIKRSCVTLISEIEILSSADKFPQICPDSCRRHVLRTQSQEYYITQLVVIRLSNFHQSNTALRNGYNITKCGRKGQQTLVLQKVPSELHPKVRNHGEGPY